MIRDRRILLQGALFFIAIVLYVFALQGVRGLYSSDEGRYTDVALQMLSSGDWLHPKLAPDVSHWSKPPLIYWVIAASLAVFGNHEFAARFPNSLAFLTTLALIGRVGRRITPRQPWRPTIIYGSMLLPLLASNIVTTDTLLTLFATLQLYAGIELWINEDDRGHEGFRAVLWMAAGMAFLTKGPPGLLPLCALILCALFNGGFRAASRFVSVFAFILFLVIGFSWYLTVIAEQPQLLKRLVQIEVINRVSTDSAHRNAQWFGAFKIYFPTLIFGTLPWILPAIWKRAHSMPYKQTTIATSRETRVLWFLVLVPLIIFMIVRSRLPLYILPIFPPIACLIAVEISEVKWRSSTFAMGALFEIVLALASLYFSTAGFAVSDDRRLATTVERIVPFLPAEIGFIQTEPRYGLRFYFGSVVRSYSLSGFEPDPESAQLSTTKPIDSCRIWLVKPWNLETARRELASINMATQTLGNAADYSVLADLSNACGSKQQDTRTLP